MGLSFSHLFILLLIILVVFGAGKLPNVMGDIAKGIKAFKDGLKEGEADEKSPPPPSSPSSKNDHEK